MSTNGSCHCFSLSFSQDLNNAFKKLKGGPGGQERETVQGEERCRGRVEGTGPWCWSGETSEAMAKTSMSPQGHWEPTEGFRVRESHAVLSIQRMTLIAIWKEQQSVRDKRSVWELMPGPGKRSDPQAKVEAEERER